MQTIPYSQLYREARQKTKRQALWDEIHAQIAREAIRELKPKPETWRETRAKIAHDLGLDPKPRCYPHSAAQKAIWRSVWLPILRTAIEDNRVTMYHIAKATKIHQTLLHKYSCRKCEHGICPTTHNLHNLTNWLANYHKSPYCMTSLRFATHRKGRPPTRQLSSK